MTGWRRKDHAIRPALDRGIGFVITFGVMIGIGSWAYCSIAGNYQTPYRHGHNLANKYAAGSAATYRCGAAVGGIGAGSAVWPIR